MRTMHVVALGALLLAACASAEMTVNYKPGMRLHPISNIPQQNYTLLTGATVSIEEGYADGDQLMLDYAGEFNIQSKFDSRTGTLFINGSATVSEYARAIQDVVFTTLSELGGSRRVTWSFGENTLYSTRTRHFYTFIADTGIAWASALERCNLTSLLGMQGYLATVTSAVEMDALSRKAWMSAWIAGRADSQWQWTWAAGPEMSWPAFWSGPNMYRGGSAVNGGYSSWGRFQPSAAAGTGFLAIQPSMYDAYSAWYSYPNTAGVQGLVCEYGGMDSPSVTAMSQNFAGTVLMQFGCANFTSQSECMNQRELGCTWSGSCVQSTCTKHATQLECQTDASCDWNMNGAIGMCVDTPCASLGTATCAMSTMCFAPANNGTCRPSMCSDMKTACGCRALSDTCMWNGQCFDEGSYKCDGMDVVYMFDGSATMGQRFGLASSGYVGLTTMLQEADQLLTGSSPGAVPTTAGMRVGYVAFGSPDYEGVARQGVDVTDGALTGSLAQKWADLNTLGTAFANSPTRYLETAASVAKGMFDGAGATTRQKAVVIFAAGPIADAASVAATLASMSGVTFYGVALRPTPTATADSTAAMADLKTALPAGSPVVGLTLSQVTSQAIFGLCNPQTPFGAAALAGKTIAPMCSDRATQTDCDSAEFCSWSYSASSCVRSHCGRLCQDTCAADTTCKWENNRCGKTCFGTVSATSPCTGCQVVNSMCFPPKCQGNPTEDACIADTEKCVFNSTAMTPCKPIVCPMFTSETTCPSTCTWSNAQCMADPCKTRSKTSCTSLAQCAWGTPAGSQRQSCFLEPYCGTRLTEVQCAKSVMCKWNVTVGPAACTLAPCTGLNTMSKTLAATACMADSRCMWNATQDNGYCNVKVCEMNPDAKVCSGDDSCVWRNATCKDSRYAQCEPVDLFFLVEGTLAMRQDFGRHPSGFMGVMESLRAWSRDAPWSADVASTGYRMGVALYGATESKAVPDIDPSSRERSPAGNGKYFISDPARFLGVDGALDFLQGQVAAFSEFAGTNNFLRPGLVTAQTMFATGPTTRKRVLVILGASPFTDGDASPVGPVITELEAMGVSIFSTIIRRFSTITPVELKAEDFMKPLASDPASTHFLYTSIENLRPMLLDSFCDPSTAQGMSLSVSRDNTLPCSWLAQGECSLQRNCMWNATATKTCPMSTQCPNLGCQELPVALQGMFTCPQCSMVSGKVSCSATPKAAEKGLCKPNNCALMYGTAAACSADTTCVWSADRMRCDASPCTALSAGATCNANLGCYWMQASSTCMQSMSWRARSQASCLAVMTTYGSGPTASVDKANFWNASGVPAVCVPRRCPYLTTQSDCNGALGQAQDCTFTNSLTCTRKACPYKTSSLCASDAACYWNPYDTIQGTCVPIPSDGSCAVSQFSNFSQCTATCGAAIQFRSRRILSFRDVTMPSARTCTAVAESMSQAATGVKLGMVDSRTCNVPTDCASHCANYTLSGNRLGCARDISCRWRDGCEALTFRNCAELSTETDCGKFSDACSWDPKLLFCVATLTKCTSYNQQQCTASSSANCIWRSGGTANALATSLGVPVQLVNPGPQQKPIFVFPELSVSSDEIINGATVTIEKYYQRNKDKLALLYPSALTATWSPAAGTLTLSGTGTIGDYVNAIRYVTFETTSAVQNPRVVTWALRSNTVYSGMTQKVFTYFPSVGISWDAASAACRASSYWGKRGYLAVLNNADDTNVVASKLWAQGWIGASDSTSKVWQWVTGIYSAVPLQFWTGSTSLAGGRALGGAFTQWNSMEGQPNPTGAPGSNYAYVGESGMWWAKESNWTQAQGYVCEYGGLPTDMPSAIPTSGAAVVGAGGCMPVPCIWRTNTSCTLDSECTNATRCLNADQNCTQVCVQSCSSKSSPQECDLDTRCKWDTEAVPAACSWNPCKTSDQSACSAHARCTWNPVLGCTFKTGCAALTTDSLCRNATACVWSSGSCSNVPCTSIVTAEQCNANPYCTFSSGVGCADAACRATTPTDCLSSTSCTWAAGDATVLGFNVGGALVKPFTGATGGPGDLGGFTVTGATVMITQGFQVYQDRLSVTSGYFTNNAGSARFDPKTGTLYITFPPTTSALTAYAAIQQVTFATTSTVEAPRTIVYSLGAFSVLSTATTTPTYLRYFAASPGQAVNASDAPMRCSQSSHFGVAGKLASILSAQDAINLRRFGPSAWIGAQASFSGQNQWQWSANGQTFWQLGAGQFGPVTGRFAYWASGEPMLASQSQPWLQAMVTPDGTWKAVVSTSAPQGVGYVCQYSAPDSTYASSGSRQMRAQGCFLRPCAELPLTGCAAKPGCFWDVAGSRCGVETFCSSGKSPSDCDGKAGCYWDYASAVCTVAAPTTCTDLPNATCTNATLYPLCGWDNTKLTKAGTFGACVTTDCAGFGIAECNNRPQCVASTSGSSAVCTRRLCGYVTREKCFTDTRCQWNGTASTCAASSCLYAISAAECASPAYAEDCQFDASTARCIRRQCAETTAVGKCQANPVCVLSGSTCTAPGCEAITAEGACNSNPLCYYRKKDVGSACITKRCNSNLATESQCLSTENGGASCQWKVVDGTGQCIMKDNLYAPETIDSCQKEITPSLWWLWVLCVIILILLAAIGYRIFLAFTKKMNFLDPNKNTQKFSPHLAYKDIAFEEAQQIGQETNEGYQKPSINDL